MSPHITTHFTAFAVQEVSLSCFSVIINPTMHKHNTKPCGRLTGIGDGKAVGRLDVVHVRHQVERGFRGVRAGVVQEDCQTKGSVLLISVSDEQTAWTEGKETHDDVKKKKKKGSTGE